MFHKLSFHEENAKRHTCGTLRDKSKFPWALFSFSAACVIAAAPTAVSAAVPPGINANDAMVQIGYLPVTLYGAVPNDGKDDTAAIQKAINAARDYGYVTFFPSGTYNVSDTLYAMQRVFKTATGDYKQDRREANVLVGSTTGTRPVLKLTNGAGFANAAAPKPLVWIWAQPRDRTYAGSTDPRDEQPNISFNQVFKGIDIDVRGAAGAIGLRHAGSQGSALEDVTVLADGAYAGFYNIPGQGGGAYNIEVQGGRYGIIAENTTRFPIVAGATFVGQTEAAIRWDGNSNFTLAGFRIETSSTKPVLPINARAWGPSRAFTLVDGSIKSAGLAIENADATNVYLKNVYVSGTSQVVRSGSLSPVLATTGAPWTKVSEYSHTGKGGQSLVDGVFKGEGQEFVSIGTPVVAPPADLVSRHVWTKQFPSVEDADAVNVKRYGARGDGVTDDTAAIKRALAENAKVFLPKGDYVVSDTITLGASNHLFGVAKNLSVIKSSQKWTASPADTPIVTTVDQASAKTSLSFLLIESHVKTPQLTFLEWRAGRESLVRDILIGVDGFSLSVPDLDHKGYVVRGNGGGRWYSVTGEWTLLQHSTDHPNYRHFLAENTVEPLSVYGLNVERSHVDPQAEIRNAKNVQIFYLKGESLDTSAGVMKIVGSNNVMVFGYSGNASPQGNELIEVVDSENVILSTIAHLTLQSNFETAKEQRGGAAVAINGLKTVGMVKRGNASLVKNVGADSVPCGPAPYNAATTAAIVLWKDCGTDNWTMRAAAGGGTLRFVGGIRSDLPFASVKGEMLESTDILKNAPDATRIDFSLDVNGKYQDGFKFTPAPGSNLCIRLGDSRQYVMVGPKLVRYAGSVDLRTMQVCD